jgi:hypothetical protein
MMAVTADSRGGEPRVLIVVARERRDLFDYFEHHLADIDDIKIVLDRRMARRDPPVAGERREREDNTDELQQRGFIIIHLL